MKRFVLLVLLTLSACTPSEQAIQTAIAQTQAVSAKTQIAPTEAECMAWGKIDKTYAGEQVCVRGIVESKVLDIALTFSDAPNTLYIAWEPYFTAGMYSRGNCIMVYGYVAIDKNQTPYIKSERVANCASG